MLISELALHLVHVQNLVPGERHVGIDVIVESAPCRFLPPQGDFVTVIVHFADIQRGRPAAIMPGVELGDRRMPVRCSKK